MGRSQGWSDEMRYFLFMLLICSISSCTAGHRKEVIRAFSPVDFTILTSANDTKKRFDIEFRSLSSQNICFGKSGWPRGDGTWAGAENTNFEVIASTGKTYHPPSTDVGGYCIGGRMYVLSKSSRILH